MKKLLVPMTASLLLSVGTVSYAQQQPPPQQERQRSPEQGTPTTLRGCLTKGSQAQEYVVANEKTGEKVPFAGSSKLDSYVNQTVEITGQMTDSGTFVPQSIKSVAASCKGAPEKDK